MTHLHQRLTWVAALLFGASLMVSAPAHAGDYSETCRYFAGEAFKDRRARSETTFRMDLAQDCVDALVYRRSDRPEVRARAEAYLEQLQAYRELMIDMLVARARARTPGEASLRRHVRPAVAPVSWAGAYLIARRMGLVETHEDWTEWRQSVASADPRLRLE